MFKHLMLTLVIVMEICLGASSLMAQSKEAGIKLFDEAKILQQGAKSNQDLKKAVENYEQSLQIFEKTKFEQGIGSAANNLGLIYADWGQFAKATEYYDKSLKARKKAGDQAGEAQTLSNLGNVHQQWGQYAKAAAYYERSLELIKNVGEEKGEGGVLMNLGAVHAAQGQYAKAVEYYEKSLVLRNKTSDLFGEGQTLLNLGNVYYYWGQYAKALEYFEKSLEIVRKVGDVRGEGTILMNLGLVDVARGEYEKAVQNYGESLKIRKKIGDLAGEAQLLLNVGTVYLYRSQYTKAVEYFEKSLEVARKVGDVSLEGTILMNLGLVHAEQGQYAKAVDHHQESLQIRKKIGDVRGEADTLNNLGLAYWYWGQYAKAVDYYEKTLEIRKRIGDVGGEGIVLMNLGLVHSDWGQYVKSAEFYDRSMAIARRIGDVRGEGRALTNVGRLFASLGQYAMALDNFQKALEIIKKLGDEKAEGTILMNFGVIHSAQGQYGKAVDHYEKCVGIARKFGDVKGEALTVLNLGNIYHCWGQHAKAVGYYEKCLEICAKLGSVNEEAIALTNLGHIYATQGHYDQALANFQKALAVFRKMGVPPDLATSNIGNLYLDLGEIEKAETFIKQSNQAWSLGRLSLMKADYPSAISHYENILKMGEQNRSAEHLFIGYTGLGMAYEGTNDNLRAIEHYRKAIEHTEDLRSSLNPTERETFFDVRISGFYRTAPYDGLARVLLKMNRHTEAFRESEYTRARIFAEAISKRSEHSDLDVPKVVRDKDSLLADELAALLKNLQKGYEKHNKEVIATLEPQVKQARAKLAAHVEMVRKEYPLFGATRYPQPMALTQADLKENEWVLAYHVMDPGIIIYLTRGRDLVKDQFKPVTRKEIDNLVRTFRESFEMAGQVISVQTLAKFEFATAKRLSDILLADILSDLPNNAPLIIIPDGSLGVVPFEMLVLNEGGKVQSDKKIPYVTGAEFFGDRNAISYYQSVTAMTLARTLGKQQKIGERTLAMVDPVFSAEDARLPKAAAEKRRAALDKVTGEKLMSFKSDLALDIPRLPLTSQLGEFLKKADPAKTDLYEGLKAEKTVLLRNDLTPYRSCIFATHGYFGKDLPGIQEPVLILTLAGQPQGQDGFLRMSEVMGLKLNADMVALTACQSGLGRTISGEGTMGMGRAFQYAGAKSVLMSLWSVADKSSVMLTESFFKHLRDGRNKLEALKLARDEIRQAGYDHPFFWAPFILVGEVE